MWPACPDVAGQGTGDDPPASACNGSVQQTVSEALPCSNLPFVVLTALGMRQVQRGTAGATNRPHLHPQTGSRPSTFFPTVYATDAESGTAAV